VGFVSASSPPAKGQTAQIQVTGTGDSSPDQALAGRRAKAVAMALIAGGLARDAIALPVAGDTQSPIAIGVDATQPRRVEIAIR
jgi:outer membrane protein OmpA-like peptidoglycan-associated protein